MASIAGLLTLKPIVRTVALLLFCSPDGDNFGSLLLKLFVVLKAGVASELRLLPWSVIVPEADVALVGKSRMEFFNRNVTPVLPL